MRDAPNILGCVFCLAVMLGWAELSAYAQERNPLRASGGAAVSSRAAFYSPSVSDTGAASSAPAKPAVEAIPPAVMHAMYPDQFQQVPRVDGPRVDIPPVGMAPQREVPQRELPEAGVPVASPVKTSRNKPVLKASEGLSPESQTAAVGVDAAVSAAQEEPRAAAENYDAQVVQASHSETVGQNLKNTAKSDLSPAGALLRRLRAADFAASESDGVSEGADVVPSPQADRVDVAALIARSRQERKQKAAANGGGNAGVFGNGSDGDTAVIDEAMADGAIDEKAAEQAKLMQLIKQLAINTAIVLAIAIGFLLVLKVFMKGGSKLQVAAAAKTPIEVISTLKISSKASLMLVQAGDSQLVVASDQNGIQSVVPINESYADAFSAAAAASVSPDATPTPSVSFADTIAAFEKKTLTPPASPGVQVSSGTERTATPVRATVSAIATEPSSDTTSPFVDDDGAGSDTAFAQSLEGLYSLASVGRRAGVQSEAQPATEEKPAPQSQRQTKPTLTKPTPARPTPAKESAEDEIRRKMEAALAEHGIKDLFLKSLRAQAG